MSDESKPSNVVGISSRRGRLHDKAVRELAVELKALHQQLAEMASSLVAFSDRLNNDHRVRVLVAYSELSGGFNRLLDVFNEVALADVSRETKH
ncbi:MAG: hypothetical protein KDJ27_13445 [Gammaproteobacteria bacterium]|nr:hypothetical protein [Gammaproteobacteria bacterium]